MDRKQNGGILCSILQRKSMRNESISFTLPAFDNKANFTSSIHVKIDRIDATIFLTIKSPRPASDRTNEAK
jgi:hypothetical protein